MLARLAVAQHKDLARVARHLELARRDQPQLACQQAARAEHVLDQPCGDVVVHGGQRVVEQVDLRTQYMTHHARPAHRACADACTVHVLRVVRCMSQRA